MAFKRESWVPVYNRVHTSYVLCECEHADHGHRCGRRAQVEISTTWGRYKVCRECRSEAHMDLGRHGMRGENRNA